MQLNFHDDRHNKAASLFAYVNVNIPNLSLQEKKVSKLHYNQVDTGLRCGVYSSFNKKMIYYY